MGQWIQLSGDQIISQQSQSLVLESFCILSLFYSILYICIEREYMGGVLGSKVLRIAIVSNREYMVHKANKEALKELSGGSQ